MKQTSKALIQGGYTLAEIVTVAALLLVIAAIFFASLADYSSRQSLVSLTEDIRIGLNEARVNTLASRDATRYGVYVGTTSVALFTGDSFSTSSIPDSEIQYSNTIIATSSFSDGNWYVVFNRLDGVASATGTITTIDLTSGATRTITIYQTGLIE